MVLALRVPEADFMGAAGLHRCHHLGNGRAAILSKAIHAAAHQKPGPQFLGKTVEFVNVAFSVTDMHAALGRTCQLCGQADTFPSSCAMETKSSPTHGVWAS